MCTNDLRIIRSPSNQVDIKRYSRTKKAGQSVKNLRQVLFSHGISDETIEQIMKDIQTGKEETM
jgi:SOS response regulatory protein OraA/RecX